MHGFPAALTSFIGRAEPLREVAGLLSDRRLVTVTGPGGAGKTRLAAQVARQVADRFADGAWLVELAPVADPAQVAAVVAAALGVREQLGLPAAEALARALARQQVLLVLDNCEHVIGAAAALCAGLLAACDDVRVLATSREPLRVAGEARYRLASLALPDLDDLAEAARAEAVALFADRARDADAHFTLDDETAPAVARLVTRLDGMPLAIELAAAQVEALGVAGLLDRLDDRLALLAGGDRLAPSRQRSLAATVEWSYQLLDEDRAAGVPARCRCSRRRFTLEGAEAVAGRAAGPAVLRLVDCSLLTPPRAGPDGRSRYSMLETLRAYGAGRLAETGEQDQAAAALAGYALAVAEEAAAGLQTRTGERGGRALAGRGGRHHAAGAGLGHGHTTRRWRCGWRSRWAGGGSCAAGWPVSARCCRGHRATPSQAVTSGAPRSSCSAGPQSSRPIWPRRWSISPRCATRSRPGPVPGAGRRPGRPVVRVAGTGPYPEAAEDARRALAVAREIGHPFGEVVALLALAFAAAAAGDHADAVRLARQAGRSRATSPAP